MTTPNDSTRYICLFHDTERARAAVHALENAGVGSGSVTTLHASDAGSDQDIKGRLSAIGVPDRDLKHLQEGISKGGVVVSLEAGKDRSDDIEKVFHHFTADKIDEADLKLDEPYTPPVAAATGLNDALIPVMEESLVVGKREVDRGGVRVFSRTVEEPVSESVSLHDEHVLVERRPVDRAVTDADINAGSREIAMEETAEVPVVQKVARVVEEVRVGKVGSDRTETVTDTVRHTEVDVEQVEGTNIKNGKA